MNRVAKTQEEFDGIVKETGIVKITSGEFAYSGDGEIYVSGTARLTVAGTAVVFASGDAEVIVNGGATVQASGGVAVMAYDDAIVMASGNCLVKLFDSSMAAVSGDVAVEGRDESTVVSVGRSVVKAYGSCSVITDDVSRVEWDSTGVRVTQTKGEVPVTHTTPTAKVPPATPPKGEPINIIGSEVFSGYKWATVRIDKSLPANTKVHDIGETYEQAVAKWKVRTGLDWEEAVIRSWVVVRVAVTYKVLAQLSEVGLSD